MLSRKSARSWWSAHGCRECLRCESPDLVPWVFPVTALGKNLVGWSEQAAKVSTQYLRRSEALHHEREALQLILFGPLEAPLAPRTLDWKRCSHTDSHREG
jgi:hypothetical protein